MKLMLFTFLATFLLVGYFSFVDLTDSIYINVMAFFGLAHTIIGLWEMINDD